MANRGESLSESMYAIGALMLAPRRPAPYSNPMEYALAILFSALAMTFIVGGRYLLTSGFFAWLTGRVRPGYYDRLKPQMGREIRWSLLSAAIYGVPAGIVAWGWQNAGWTRSGHRDTDSRRRFGFGIADHDGYGRVQSYGVGDVSALARSG